MRNVHKARRAVKLLQGGQRACKEVWSRSTPRRAKTWASRPLPTLRAADISASGSPWLSRARLSAGRTGSQQEETRMAALDHVSHERRRPVHGARRRPTRRASTSARTASSSCSRSSSTCTASRTPSSSRPSHLDDLLDRGRRLRRLRRRRHRPDAELDPDMAAMPDVAQPHAAAVAPRRRALRLRRARRGRGVAVLPAHDPAPPARPRARRSATSSRSAPSSSTSSCARSEDGSIELADPLDTLDQPCYDMRAPDAQPRLRRRRSRATSRRSGGTTTRPTTRTPTASSSRTSSSPTR